MAKDKVLRKILEKYIKHYYCEDSWYSCKAYNWDEITDENKCSCGRNEEIDAIITAIQASFPKKATEKDFELFNATSYKDMVIGANRMLKKIKKNLGL